MKKIAFLSLFSLLAIGACKKDSIGTKPVITFKSYSSSPVSADAGMDITFNVTDGDGDIENTFNFAAIYDVKPLDTPFTSRPMPKLDAHKGTKLTAEVVLHLINTDFPQIADNPIKKDSVHYLVFIQDDAGNYSDTIVTPKLQVVYPQN
ncbi:hypothetical protein [Chitinophaga sancti]|uniref:DUF4625 domain-containing protein n=1 Tax=Chitinophaga sancti TaxID=1004 RepID=A0A1K1QW39_9BACT|nr:hypothetical protein [Chitinophaga sancti]WQD61953.1 hypothetical protein U0033_29125 [Chitinophaga sancti]WQG92478.1 hypothetical protein SR876_13260 [Chitinophaga sancti]SFW63526.1 hypothetical protein SAMN05661012_03089 [Chitinophaga sancti]